MNITTQKCNACPAVKAAGETGWYRCFGLYGGAQEIKPVHVQAQDTAEYRSIVAVDVCPACAAKLTMAALAALMPPLPPPPVKSQTIPAPKPAAR